jgi:trk system potassium uptake protein
VSFPNVRRFQFTPPQVLVLGFAALIAIGTGLLMLPVAHESGQAFPLVDALFTATSAVCVTGLIVVDTATQFSTFGELVVLGLIQAGGLGIMTLSALMLLALGRRVSLQDRLRMQEALGSFSIAGVVRLTRNIIYATLAIEGTGMALLTSHFLLVERLPLGKALYWGFYHSVSAFNNAGFDVTTASLRPFAKAPLVLLIIGTLISLGSIGFPVMDEWWRNKGKWHSLSLHSRLAIKATLTLLVVGTALLAVTEWNNPNTLGTLPWYHKLSNAWFASVTARTAGYESVSTAALRDVSLLILVLLMFIGAAPGGTGGGIKTTTFTMIMLNVRAIATGKDEVELMGRRIARDLIDKAMVIATISVLLVITVSGLLLVTEMEMLEDPSNPISMIRVLVEVVSGFATVGLTAGLTPVLTTAGKLLVAFTMFVGRVGPLTLAVALAKRKYARSPIHLPEDRVMIG